MIEQGKWTPVSGANNFNVFPFVISPNVNCCNTFLIFSKNGFFLIDSGADAGLVEKLNAAAKEKDPDEKLPVIIFLTHCHFDHTGLITEKGKNLLGKRPHKLLCHKKCAEALETADDWITLSALSNVKLNPLKSDITLFGDVKETDVFAGVTLREDDSRPFVFDINFSGSGTVQIISTPGHSPDSCCVLVGDALFSGDLLLATAPFTAGIPGWDAKALISTLSYLIDFTEKNPQLGFFPGHGIVMDSSKGLYLLQKALSQCESLQNIAVYDSQRKEFIAEYGHALIDDLTEKFESLVNHLNYLADHLNYLEEKEAADEIKKILDKKRVRSFLEDYELMQVALRSGKKKEMELPFKVLETLAKLKKLVDFNELENIVDPFLLKRMKILVSDFQKAAHGHVFMDNAEQMDLSERFDNVIRKTFNPLGEKDGAEIDLDIIPHDEAGFLKHLIKQIAYTPKFKKIKITKSFNPKKEIIAPLIPEKFDSYINLILTCLSEENTDLLDIKIDPHPKIIIKAHFNERPQTPLLLRLMKIRRWLPTAAMDAEFEIQQKSILISISFMEQSGEPR